MVTEITMKFTNARQQTSGFQSTNQSINQSNNQ